MIPCAYYDAGQGLDRQGGQSGQKQGSRVKDSAACENAPVYKYMLVRFCPTIERATAALINGLQPPPLPKHKHLSQIGQLLLWERLSSCSC